MTGVLIQEPFLVAHLPRPVDRKSGRYVCAEVLGSEPGSRKRKRELAVGIDGEGVNLYDIASSKLITSYALPPHSFLTCSPCSVKSRKSKKNGLERRTYTSTRGTTSRLTLFKDITASDGSTTSHTAMNESKSTSNPVVYMDVVTIQSSKHVITIRQDGEIQCLDENTLEIQWSSSADSNTRGSMHAGKADYIVDYCSTIDAFSAHHRLFRGRQDILATFPHEISQEGYNPDLVAVIIRSKDIVAPSRTLYILALPTSTARSPEGSTKSVRSLLSFELPPSSGNTLCELHTLSGIFYDLQDGNLSIYHLNNGSAKLQSHTALSGGSTFLRLSDSTVALSHNSMLQIYNPRYKATQATITVSDILETNPIPAEQISSTSKSCLLVSYSKSRNVIHAIYNSKLVAFQVDMPQTWSNQGRSLGLLLDSIGNGQTALSRRADFTQQEKMNQMDKCAECGDVEGFECIMAELLGISRDDAALKMWRDQNNKHRGLQKQLEEITKPIPAWIAPELIPVTADNLKLAKYALQKIFTWVDKADYDPANTTRQLKITFFPQNVIRWLLRTGNMNHANIEMALQPNLLALNAPEIPAGQITDALVEADPGMTMLLSFLSNTYLSAAEISHVIHVLMENLELFGEETERRDLLTNGDTLLSTENDRILSGEEAEEEAAKDELRIAEYHLGDGSGVRGQALSMSIAKLHASPKAAVVQALKSRFTFSELISFIYLLRFELARGSWTSKYLDANELEDAPGLTQDSNIILVTDVLNACVDAIGSGGWLGGDAMLAVGDQFESEELITSLNLEVSAALEGVEQNVLLKGVLGDIIRYGENVPYTREAEQRSNAAGLTTINHKLDVVKPKKVRPVILPQAGRNLAMLPFGMKPAQKIHVHKIGAGGEVTRRTARDIGRLRSKKVGQYSRERILI